MALVSIWLAIIGLVALSLLQFSRAQEVYSCGGFVKSSVPLEFSKVMVKLYTRDMHLKYETDCAPNNGYYMIPVYSKGNYIIKVHPPAGWNFEPERVELVVDGVDDPCTKGVDLNFNFLGYSVSGQVLSRGSDSGPTGFAIALTKEGDKEPLVVTETSSGGKYEFMGILPGNYYITNVDSSMCVEKKQTTIPVQVTGQTVAPPLRIEGYSITGYVKNEAQPVARAQILLYAETKTTLSGCDTTPLSDFNLPPAAAGLHFVCRQATAAKGEFKFACAPSGNYVMVPFYKSDGVTFDLAPKTTKISISHGAVEMKEPFRVVGFTVPGRVLWQPKGTGVHGAEVFVNDKFTSQTNQNGDYLLERMSAGKYKVTAKRDGVEFATVDVELSPKNHQIPNIVANAFQICGSVVLHSFPSTLPKLTQRKLLLTNLDSKEVFSLTTGGDGSFCRMVQPGSYLIEPQILPNEKQAGIVLVPKERKIVVSDKPIREIKFAQFEAKVSGIIECTGVCKQVKVQLVTASNEEVSSIHFPSIQDKETFQFTHLLPGSYTVKLLTEHYCWEKQELRVNIEQTDVTGLNFRQTGFAVAILSTSEASLQYTQQGAPSIKGTVNLKSGTNNFCLPQAGVYDIKLESCHRFEPPSLQYNTNNPGALSVTAVEHAVTGSVVTAGSSDDVKINVRTNEGAVIQKIGPLSDGSNASGRWEYAFKYWAKANQEIILEPTSKVYLFTPEKHTVKIKSECVLNAVKFVGSKGLFLECRVEPALAGVKITMKEKDSELVKFEGVTDEKGQCSLGPVRSFDGYTVGAAMQGFTFEGIGGQVGRFKAFKLSELIIKAVDTNKTPLSGVLISLSGTNYRSNNLTDETGTMTFFGLTPGEYFLRPVLKEFSFQPATHLVKISEGSLERIEVVGRRVAYSCSGVLRYLAGQPVAGAVLEAVSAGCNHVQEEASTGEDGTFRIRGLLPSCDYVLKMKDNQDWPATFPRQLPIKVKEEDITGIELVSRPHLTTTDIAGYVDCDRELLPSLRLLLFKGDAPVPVHSIHLQGAVFFPPSVNMDNATYTARLESSLSEKEYENSKPPEITFKANETSKFLTFVFKPKRKSAEAEISSSSFIALPLTIILILAAYNYEKLSPLAREWMLDIATFINSQQQQTNKSNPSSSSADSGGTEIGDSSADAAGGTKKKGRARKT